MLAKLKRHWHGLEHGTPGRRFQERYQAARRGQSVPLWHRVLRMIVAAVAFAIGVILVFIPGPAFVFFALSGALVATESRYVAKALDAVEVRGRALVRGAARIWQRGGWAARIALVGAGAVVGVGAGLVAAWVFYTR